MDILDKELHRVAITAIIYNDEGKYLITRRALNKKASPGKWTVPGGGLTIDDYIHLPSSVEGDHPQWYGVIEKGLIREIKEEVNCEVEKPEFLLDLAFIRPDNIPVLVLSYFAKYKSGEVAYDEATIDHAWVTLEEAKKYDLINGIWDELEMIEKKLKKS